MAVPTSLRSLFLVVPALLLCLGGDGQAYAQRRGVKKAKTTKVRAAKTGRTSKTAGRTRTAKVTLTGTRGTKAKASKELVSGKSTKAKTTAEKTKPSKTAKAGATTTKAKSTKTKATTTKARTTKARSSKTTAKKTTAKKTTAKKTTAKKTTAKKTTAKPSSKDKPLSQSQREQIAIERVLSRGETLVRSTPFNGDTANPITGLGPIEVQVRQKVVGRGRLQRFMRMFSPSAERTHLVMVDAEGNATKLNSRANSPVYRLFHGIANTIPIRELAHDIVNSSGVRNGIFTAILGGAATAWNPVGTVGIFRGAQLMLEGIKRRTDARNTVFEGTVKWANRMGSKGKYPNLVNAYRYYKTQLQKTKPGTRPATLKNFAERLAGNGL